MLLPWKMQQRHLLLLFVAAATALQLKPTTLLPSSSSSNSKLAAPALPHFLFVSAGDGESGEGNEYLGITNKEDGEGSAENNESAAADPLHPPAAEAAVADSAAASGPTLSAASDNPSNDAEAASAAPAGSAAVATSGEDTATPAAAPATPADVATPAAAPATPAEAATPAGEAAVPYLLRRPYSEKKGGFLKVPQSFLDRRKGEEMTQEELEQQLDKMFTVNPDQVEAQSAAIARSVEASRGPGQRKGRIIIAVADLQAPSAELEQLLKKRVEDSEPGSGSEAQQQMNTRAEAEAFGIAALHGEELQQQHAVDNIKVLPDVGLVVIDFSQDSSEAEIRETVKRIWLESPAAWLIEADSEVKIRDSVSFSMGNAAAAAAADPSPFRLDEANRRRLMEAEELYGDPRSSSSSKAKQQQQQQQRNDKAAARKQKQEIKALQAEGKQTQQGRRTTIGSSSSLSSSSKQQQQQQLSAKPKTIKPPKELQQRQQKVKAQQQQEKASPQQRQQKQKQQKSPKLKAQQRDGDSVGGPLSPASQLGPEPLSEAYLKQLQLPPAVVATPEQLEFGVSHVPRLLSDAVETPESERAAAKEAKTVNEEEAAPQLSWLPLTKGSLIVPAGVQAFPAAAAATTAAAELDEMGLEESEELLEKREEFLNKDDGKPNDLLFARQWALNHPVYGCKLPAAWRLAYKRRKQQREADEANGVPRSVSEQIIVAVIDTGVDYTHEDLRGRLWKNYKEIPNNGIDDDGNGYVDDYHGFDFERGSADPMDDHGHGTHVAGIVAASANNGIGVAGGNWRVKLMPLKFEKRSSAAVEAIAYSLQMGAKVSTNSWGFAFRSEALRLALEQAEAKGQLFVSAVDNAGSDNTTAKDFPPNWGYDWRTGLGFRNILRVANLSPIGKLSKSSNYGRYNVDIAAPGTDIISTLPGRQFGDKYGYKSGTSMATPLVAAIAAMVWAERPSLSAAEVREVLIATAFHLPSLENVVASKGVVDAKTAVELAHALNQKDLGYHAPLAEAFVLWQRQQAEERKKLIAAGGIPETTNPNNSNNKGLPPPPPPPGPVQPVAPPPPATAAPYTPNPAVSVLLPPQGLSQPPPKPSTLYYPQPSSSSGNNSSSSNSSSTKGSTSAANAPVSFFSSLLSSLSNITRFVRG